MSRAVVTVDESTLLSQRPEGAVVSYKGASKLFLNQAAPALAERFVEIVGGFLNNLFLARSSNKNTLPASAYINAYQQFLMNFNMITVSSSVNMLSGENKNDPEKVAEVFRNGLWLSVALSIPTILLSIFSKDILIGFKQDPEFASVAQEYFRIFSIGVLPDLFLAVEKSFVSGVLEKPTSIAVIETLNTSLTTVLGYLLINGTGALPQLGAAGLGYAVAISNWFSFAAYSAYIGCNEKYREYPLLKGSPYSKSVFIELLKRGIPGGLMLGVELGSVFAGSLMAGKLGKDDLSAQQISLQYYMLILSINISLARAGMACVSRAIGDDQRSAIKPMIVISNMIGLVFTVIASLIVFALRSPLVNLFIDNSPENKGAASMAENLLWINGIALLPDALRFITGFSTMPLNQGAGMLLSTVVGLAFFGLPISAALGFATSLGVLGIAVGRGVGVTTGAGISGLFARNDIKDLEAPAQITHLQSDNLEDGNISARR